MTLLSKIGVAILVVFAGMQLVRFERTNPPVKADLRAAPEVTAVLRRACYDCHSNETAWPWYSRVAPISWVLHRDVIEGRADLNFSDWEELSSEERARQQHEIFEQVADGEMPPWYYVALHSSARLSPGDKALLERWAGANVKPGHRN